MDTAKKFEGLSTSWRSPAALVTLVVLLAALAIRLWMMPPLYNQPHWDETAYMIDGLLMLEGVTPGTKFAPGAVTTWPGFIYGGLSSLALLLSPSEEIARQSTVLKPLYAIDRALFDAYADHSGLRAAVMGTVFGISLFGVLMACRLGGVRAGWPGVLLCGGLMAFIPVIVILSVETRPYAAAWSFAIAAIAFSAVLTGQWRWIAAGLCFGLAVASRIEMVLIAPLIAWEFWLRPEKTKTVRALLCVAGISLLTFLVVAPWYITHLVGNVRKIVTVPFEPRMKTDTDIWVGLFDLLWSEGLLAVAVLLVIGLALRPGRERTLAVAAGLFIVVTLLLFGGSNLSRYNGAAFIGIIAFAPYALVTLQKRLSSRFSTMLAGIASLLLVMPAVAQTINAGLAVRAGWVEPKVVEWLAENVPAGTRVYTYPWQIRAIPPTAESADGMWRKLADPDAWRARMQLRLSQSGLEVDRMPRALSIDFMQQRLGPTRRWYFLASPYWGAHPQYDIRFFSYGERADSSLSAWGRADPQIVEEFVHSGGVFVHYGWPVTVLGEPVVAWTAADGTGVFVYLRPGGDS